jgi:HD-like signal output (HDOD) protein
MLERPFKDLESWVHHLSAAELPVLKRTAQQLDELRQREDRVTSPAIAQVVLQDPLMALKVLAYLEARRRRSQITDITTIDRAIMMLGVSPFFSDFERLVRVEDQLAAHPQALLGLLRVVARAKRAAHFARDWALLRHDLDVEEITVAALLHDVAETLLWSFAPRLALQVSELQRANPTMRSHLAQHAVLGIRLDDLQLALAQAWRLPALLVSLMDGAHSGHPRVRNVLCAVNLARHSAKGWDDPALPDDYAQIEKLLNISHEALLARLGQTAAPDTQGC